MDHPDPEPGPSPGGGGGGGPPGGGRAALREVLASFAAFFLGMAVATAYGAMALLVHKGEPWFCACSTAALAALAAFGMGLSVEVRANVLLMLPTLCSAKGKTLLLFAAATLLARGPVANTADNFERAAASLVCGRELLAGQALELARRAAAPLRRMLDALRDIAGGAHAVAGRVGRLVDALADGVRHVAAALRNVLHFLVVIGEVCNDRMGSPYRKCHVAFDDAAENCARLLGPVDFLCDLAEAARPLCGLARAPELFCVLPSYVGAQLGKRLAQPAADAFQRIRAEFEFTIAADVTVDVDIESSQSLKRMSQRILGEVSQELGKFRILVLLGGSWMGVVGLLLLAWAYYRAAQYKHKYLHQGDFDNIYITAEFRELDQRMSRAGRSAAALPLTSDEAGVYIAPASPRLATGEWLVLARGVASLLRHLALGGVLVGLDVMVFWILDLVRRTVQGDLVARAPVRLAVRVNGTGVASDIFRDVASSFDVLQRGNVTVLARECLVEPSEPDYGGYVAIGFLYGLVLLACVAGCVAQRCRRLICAARYPARERERLLFLRAHIVSERVPLGRAMWRAVTSARGGGRGDADSGGGGGDGWRSRLLALLLRVRGGSWLAALLAVSGARCLACGEAKEGPDRDDMVLCPTGRCAGLYCRMCCQSLGNSCAVCGGPLSYEDDSQDELDSSDDEKAADHSETEMSHQDMSEDDYDAAAATSMSATHSPLASLTERSPLPC